MFALAFVGMVRLVLARAIERDAFPAFAREGEALLDLFLRGARR